MEIEEKRKEIDMIDTAVVEMLNRRAAIAKELSMIKLGSGLPIRDQKRENEILIRLSQANPGVIDDTAIARIYNVIFDESRRIQGEVRVDLESPATK